MSRIAIIPARGGSKRLPHKNIRPFLGEPVIARSIRTALDSGLFDAVMVSTDDPEIARVALDRGADVPFPRSAATADDHATLAQVIREVLENYDARGVRFDTFCCILATAPLLRGERLREGLRLLEAGDFDSVVPVVRFSYPIQRSLQMDGSGRVGLVYPEFADTRSQDLPARYHDSGQFYWMRTRAFREQGTLFAARTGAVVLPETEVQDIDTEEDWALAELKYSRLCNPAI
jgi:N-acylneuraminate cytidylyltransferase